jgi:DNA polymerase elongation subunit (family B)
MSYVSARRNKKTQQIDVVERINGKRVYNSFPIDYSFYVSDSKGKYTSIYNTPLTKITPKSSTEFYKELSILQGKTLWETDLNPVFKCLAANYSNQPVPDLHIAMVDIECEFNKEKGYAPPEDPFNMITAITIDLVWEKKLITLVIPPDNLEPEQIDNIINKFDNTIAFTSEIEMLDAALSLIEDSDVISGWNSSGFDIPYLVNRVARIMSGDDTRRFCLWDEKPQIKKMEKYGKEVSTYELVGRVHLDLLDVYRKFTYEERHSYSLDSIAEYELNSHKTSYEGSLDSLYHNNFEKFIEYNRNDVLLLEKLEDKLKFIALLNVIAHDTTTLIPNCMGTVAMIDQAIINRAHSLGFIVPNKKKIEIDEDGAAGAYVAYPKVGMHDYIGVTDVNSLYPSTIRALNMGLETIVAQIRPTLTNAFIKEKLTEHGMTYAKVWEGQFGSKEYQAIMSQKSEIDIIIDWEGTNNSDTLTAKQCYDLIFNSGQPWVLSGNGTIFTYAHDGIIPGLLKKWYAERKTLQRHGDEGLELLKGIEIPKKLLDKLTEIK